LILREATGKVSILCDAAFAGLCYNDGMNEQRRAKLNKSLDQILKTLVKEYRPDRVILFGSMANDQVEEWSDLDLVVIKNTGKPFFQRLKEIALLCQAPVGVDFLVYTPDEFARMKKERNPFILNEVVNKGKILYERHTAKTVA